MADYKPMMYFLIIAFIVGGFVPLTVSSFIDTQKSDNSSLISPLTNIITQGFSINLPVVTDIHIDFFFWLPNTFHDFLNKQINAFTYLPDWMSIPLLLFMITFLIYGIVSLIPGE
jgi:hypothetical protein